MMPVHPDRRPAVIAGASSGIGAAAALTLAAAGHPVVLGARRAEKCAEIARRILDNGGEAVAHFLDLADPDSVKDFTEAATRAVGDIEVVVSNAGRLALSAVHSVGTDEFACDVEVNLLGAHRLVRAFVPGMVARRRGDVVFVSSDVAGRARPFVSGYTASKWGLEGMAHAMQMELEGTGVRASIVRPGPTRSELGTDWSAEDLEFLIEKWLAWGHARHPRTLRPSVIADAILSVVSAPRGVHIGAIDVSPEAPIADTAEP
jgi:NADP-dependent 3-hydroxy acid dehydrogenase YdfG